MLLAKVGDACIVSNTSREGLFLPQISNDRKYKETSPIQFILVKKVCSFHVL